jgi:hypothetical protein
MLNSTTVNGRQPPGSRMALPSASAPVLSNSAAKPPSVKAASKRWQPPEGLSPDDVQTVIAAVGTERDRLALPNLKNRAVWSRPLTSQPPMPGFLAICSSGLERTGWPTTSRCFSRGNVLRTGGAVPSIAFEPGRSSNPPRSERRDGCWPCATGYDRVGEPAPVHSQLLPGRPRIEGTTMPHIRVTGPHSPKEDETIT